MKTIARATVEVMAVLSDLPDNEKIKILESLGKRYRRNNSVNINEIQMGRKIFIDERPDLIIMKDETN
jgi:Icc-related predicted phosphoesterase